MTAPIKLVAVSLCTVAVCALAGCKSSSKSASTATTPAASQPAAATQAATGAASAPAAASAATGTTSATKVTCSQLTFADVQPLMVDKITAVAVTAAGQTGEGQTCNWAYAGSSAGMSITVLSGQDATDTFNGDVQSLSKAVSVPGVGDKAVRDGDDGSNTVSAIKGTEYCRVAPGDGEIPGVGDLEKAAGDSSDIGDANYALEAAAAATLCNKIFGSGNTTPDLSGLLAAASAAATASPSDQGALPTSIVLPSDAASS